MQVLTQWHFTLNAKTQACAVTSGTIVPSVYNWLNTPIQRKTNFLNPPGASPRQKVGKPVISAFVWSAEKAQLHISEFRFQMWKDKSPELWLELINQFNLLRNTYFTECLLHPQALFLKTLQCLYRSNRRLKIKNNQLSNKLKMFICWLHFPL